MEELSEIQGEMLTNVNRHTVQNIQESTKESDDTDSSSARSSVGNLKDKKANKKWTLKRITPFSDSDSDSGNENVKNVIPSQNGPPSNNSSQIAKSVQEDDSESEYNSAKRIPRKSRIQKNILSESEESGSEERSQTRLSSRSNSDNEVRKSNSDCDNEVRKRNSDSDDAVKNEEQQLRMKNKRNKLKDKFKSLLTVRNKESSQINVGEEVNKMDTDESSSGSEAETASIDKIKQKIKERMTFKPSICDPDTSDEESSRQKSVYRQKKERKTRLTSPKPQRMSAKQAMENMQKIKSESNRMLREKEVTLPYHRPKAISLKDIMSRRKLAVSSDGKSLPVKMNEEQLKHYAKMLEEKQKEMLELCKSESEGEENEPNNEDSNTARKIDDCSTDNNNDINKAGLNVTNDEEKETSILGNNSDNKDSEQIEKDSDSIRLVYDETVNSFEEGNKTVLGETINDKDSDVSTALNMSKNESIETKLDNVAKENNSDQNQRNEKNSTEDDSQLISLHFDTESTEVSIKDTDASTMKENVLDNLNNSYKSLDAEENTEKVNHIHDNPIDAVVTINNSEHINSDEVKSNEFEDMDVDNFSDDDINMEDIDNIIENAEIIKNIEDKVNSQFLVRDKPLNLNPKLTGAPGMVIDLDDKDTAPRKSGVELLKERFTYFSKLKTPEELEREREKKIKPGTQLKKLKQELEEKIAEQRSLEWAKRLEDEKQQQHELKVLRGEESDDDDIDKIEAAIEGKEEIKEDSLASESSEEEPEENDIELKDKPKKRNAMVDDEAVESECEEDENADGNNENLDADENQPDDGENPENNDENEDQDDDSESESESEESSESEEEQTVTKKGRILKAFEDSDDDDIGKNCDVIEIKHAKGSTDLKSGSSCISNFMPSQVASQDDDLQLAQRPISSDLFASQENTLVNINSSQTQEPSKDSVENDEAFTQTFSILESSKQNTADVDLNGPGESVDGTAQDLDSNIEDITFQLTESKTHLPLPSQIPITQSQSQPIGEDILAMCTGQFYDNQFVSQIQNKPPPVADAINYDAFDNYQSQDSQDDVNKENNLETEIDKSESEKEKDNIPSVEKEQDIFIELKKTQSKDGKEKVVDDNLKSILDELADPEFDAPKPNKYFLSSDRNSEVHLKRKLVIDSDDEAGDGDAGENNKRKKLKKKKPEKRALQISDDEEEQWEAEEMEEYESEIEEEEQDRLVEYDSEENEIEINPLKKKKQRKMAEFFENEAELTSEDEWVGSGDEDEAGLDRMEREEGDNEVFHQGKLQKELGQIHMRDVLDQDKREVRLIQELLFEDGDLGGGGRQRKFKWSNMGEEETGVVPDEFADTQEEEFESEEQWRKQRHEREMFLRQLQNKDAPDESLNISVNRTTIIKGNLLSKTMSTILMEANVTEQSETAVTVEKNTAKDIPSLKKTFGLLQANYQGSLLSRGRGALARLAALATPLAPDDDAKVGTLGPTSRRNFVFAALTPEEKPKVTKRKAESNPSTPKIVKKIRTEEKIASRSSLLDHLKL